jgi:hypothetical protein
MKQGAQCLPILFLRKNLNCERNTLAYTRYNKSATLPNLNHIKKMSCGRFQGTLTEEEGSIL